MNWYGFKLYVPRSEDMRVAQFQKQSINDNFVTSLKVMIADNNLSKLFWSV